MKVNSKNQKFDYVEHSVFDSNARDKAMPARTIIVSAMVKIIILAHTMIILPT